MGYAIRPVGIGGRRDAVIVPITGIEEFRDALNKIIEFTKTLPEKP